MNNARFQARSLRRYLFSSVPIKWPLQTYHGWWNTTIRLAPRLQAEAHHQKKIVIENNYFFWGIFDRLATLSKMRQERASSKWRHCQSTLRLHSRRRRRSTYSTRIPPSVHIILRTFRRPAESITLEFPGAPVQAVFWLDLATFGLEWKNARSPDLTLRFSESWESKSKGTLTDPASILCHAPEIGEGSVWMAPR